MAIEQERDGDQLISRTYLDADGQPMNRVDGYAKALLELDEAGIRKIRFYNIDDVEVDAKALNLVWDIDIGQDGWSQWYSPQFLSENNIMKVGSYIY